MTDRTHRARVLADNITANARNEARALGLEWENDALARIHVANCLQAAAERLRREWGHTVPQNNPRPFRSTEQP